MKPRLKVWVVFEGGVKFGDGRARLLELVDELGSLRKALGQHAAMIETARGVGYRFRPVSAWRRDAVTAI